MDITRHPVPQTQVSKDFDIHGFEQAFLAHGEVVKDPRDGCRSFSPNELCGSSGWTDFCFAPSVLRCRTVGTTTSVDRASVSS